MRLSELSAVLFDLDGTLVPSGLCAPPIDPDVQALLSWLRARGVRVALVTNGRVRTQRAKIRSAGLEPCVDDVWISQDVGAPKPHRWIFERALRAAACEADRALFVGDDPVADIAGASRRGMRTCWVRPAIPMREPELTPDLVVGSVHELRPLLEERS